MKITTNNVPRDVIDACQLTPAERKEFDYLPWDKIEAGEGSASFFRYRGATYDLGEFMTTTAPFGWPAMHALGWHGYLADSFFSAIVVRYADDECERIVVGLALS